MSERYPIARTVNRRGIRPDIGAPLLGPQGSISALPG